MDYIGFNIPQMTKFWLQTQKRNLAYSVKHVLPQLAQVSKTRVLRDTKKGKSCFAFGNGSSLKKIDPNKIAEYQKRGLELLALNTYIETDFAKIARPDHYVLSDPMSFGISQGLFFGETAEDVKRLRRNTDLVMGMNIPIYAPLQFISRLDGYSKAFGFYDAENLFGNNTSHLLRPRGYISMTAFKMLSVALYLGFDKIYICGIDHDFFLQVEVNQKNAISYSSPHFFEASKNEKSQALQPQKHEVGTLGKGRRVGLGEMLYRWHFLFQDLEKFDASKFVNLNPTGLVDTFTKDHDLDVYV